MRSLFLLTRWGCFLIGAAVVLHTAGVARAQDLVKKRYDENSVLREQLFQGDVKADAKIKMHQDIMDASAEYFLSRVAKKQVDPVLGQKEFQAHVTKIMDKKNAKTKAAFLKLYSQALVRTIKGELDLNGQADPSVTVHMAMMLPIMARLKQPYMGDFLITLVEDKNTHDAVRLYALKAFKETMPLETQQELFPKGDWDFNPKEQPGKDQNERRESDARNINGLCRYIERKVNLPAMSSDEIATHKYLRREAIVSLAAAGTPAVWAFTKPPHKDYLKKDGGHVAPTLLKVLIPGVLRPEPTMQEKVEAAVGLCAMDYANMPEYQPEIAIYLVGQTVVEFSKEYNKDWPNFSKVGAGKLSPFVAWRTDAKRFQTGLNQLKDNARGTPKAGKSAQELQSRAKFMLDNVENAKTLQVDGGRLQDCIVLVNGKELRPKDGKVFKTLDVPPVPLK